jgi:hypothetical protein
MMKRIAETMTSGGKSAVSECGEYAQNTAKRQAEMMQQLTSYPFTSPALTAQHKEFAERYEGSIPRPVLILWRYDAQGAR